MSRHARGHRVPGDKLRLSPASRVRVPTYGARASTFLTDAAFPGAAAGSPDATCVQLRGDRPQTDSTGLDLINHRSNVACEPIRVSPACRPFAEASARFVRLPSNALRLRGQRHARPLRDHPPPFSASAA